MNQAGCDSIVVQTTNEAMQSQSISNQVTCLPNQVGDTIILAGQFCDSLVITNYIFTPLEPTIIETITCDENNIIPDTLVLSTTEQCDSLVIFEKIFTELAPTELFNTCLLYTSPSPRDRTRSRMPSSA